MGRRDHLKDYVPTGDGGYEYAGPRWSWPSGAIRTSFLKDARRLLIAAAVCLVGAGCIPAPGTFGAFYVVIPFAIGAIGTALAAAALLRLSRERDPMRGHVYTASVPALPAKLLVGAVGDAVCGAAALIHGLVLPFSAGDGGAPLLSVSFALALILAAVCLWRIRSDLAGIVFIREDAAA